MSQHRRRSSAAASPSGGRAARRAAQQARQRGGRSRLIRGDEGSSIIKRLGIVAGAGFLLAILGAIAAYAMTSIPEPNAQAVRQSSVLLYAGGKEEIVRLGDTNRFSVPLGQVPRHVRDAVLAAENRSFYSDNGVSPRGIARALWVNLKGGSVQGGSTITQQYVKNYYLEQDRTLKRKLHEAVLAIKIDNELSKDQILESYLNTIYFGRGAYGIQAASKAYFNKDAKSLGVNEGAVLASIIRAPGRYDPIENREAVEGRMQYVLDGMVEMGTITATDASDQEYPQVAKPKKIERFKGQNGYIADLVEAELKNRGIDEARIDAGGLRIETTIVKKAQQSAVEAVEEEAPKAKGLRVGLAAVEPRTGKIIAMYGGKDYLSDEPHARENNATTPVQPGSAFKAFTLAAALKDEIGLRERFAGNSPFEFGANEKVENQGDEDYGDRITLLRATQRSVNTAFVDLADRMEDGPRKIKDAAVRAGIPEGQIEDNQVNVRLTLGIADVSPLQMAGAYATFAAEGIRADAHIVEKVLRPDGGVVPLERIKPKRVFDKDVTADVTYALQGVVKPNGTGFRAQALGRPAAGKTGTHEGKSGTQKIWFAGYTPQLAAAVDIFRGDGNASLEDVDGDSVRAGGKYPALIWTAFMKGALEGKPIERFPEAANIGGSVPPYVPPVVTRQPTATSTPTVTPTPTPTVTPTPTPTRTPRARLCPPFCPETETPTPDDPPTEPDPPGPPGDGGDG
jgi:membrane peptidoglycan carboxypeptidase